MDKSNILVTKPIQPLIPTLPALNLGNKVVHLPIDRHHCAELCRRPGHRAFTVGQVENSLEGDVLDIQISASGFKGQDAKYAGSIVTLRDITIQKRAEKATLLMRILLLSASGMGTPQYMALSEILDPEEVEQIRICTFNKPTLE